MLKRDGGGGVRYYETNERNYAAKSCDHDVSSTNIIIGMTDHFSDKFFWAIKIKYIIIICITRLKTAREHQELLFRASEGKDKKTGHTVYNEMQLMRIRFVFCSNHPHLRIRAHRPTAPENVNVICVKSKSHARSSMCI